MIRVYEIPATVGPVGFLHGGGAPVPFQHVDWFNEPSEVAGLSDITRGELEAFVDQKRYRKPDRRYLVVADARPDLSFVLEPRA